MTTGVSNDQEGFDEMSSLDPLPPQLPVRGYTRRYNMCLSLPDDIMDTLVSFHLMHERHWRA
jgi:hypothetical protein